MSDSRRPPSAAAQSTLPMFHHHPTPRSSSTPADSPPATGVSRSSTTTGSSGFRSTSNQSAAIKTFYNRPIRTGGSGGFLLDGGSARSSLEQPTELSGGGASASVGSRHGDFGHGVRGNEPERNNQRTGTPQSIEEAVEEVEDAASLEVVNLALQSSSSRRKAPNRHPVTLPPRHNTPAQARDSSAIGASSLRPSTSQPSGSRGPLASPPRSFLIPDQRRSQSISIAGLVRHVSPLTPSLPSRSSSFNAGNAYPTPSLIPSPTAPVQQLQKLRGFLGQSQLRDAQLYKFSEATIQRVEKAKQYIELSALYKSILYCENHAPEHGFITQLPDGIAGGRVYNPLQVIRNRKERNRERIQLDLSPWEDPGAVQQWVEDLYVSISSPGGDSRLPPPPQPDAQAKKMKRPKKDWIIMPQELLADNYYVMQHEQIERENELRSKVEEKGKGTDKGWLHRLSHHEKEERQNRFSTIESGTTSGYSETILTRKKRSKLPDFHLESSSERLPMKSDRESSRRKKKKSATADRHQNLHRSNHDDTGNESSSTSSPLEFTFCSEGESSSDDEEVIHWDTDGNEPENAQKKKNNIRRRTLGRIMTVGKNSKREKKATTDEHPGKQEEMEWFQAFSGRTEDPRIHSQGEYGRRSYSDEEYESAITGKDPVKTGLQKTTTGLSFPTTVGSSSKNSMERYNARKSLDFPEVVVPSIAISRTSLGTNQRSYESDNEGGRMRRTYDDEIDKRKSSNPPKKLFSNAFKEKDKDRDTPESRDSLDVDRPHRKNNPIERVKSQVERLVDPFLSRRDDRAGSTSPTASSFVGSFASASEDEKGRGSLTISRENTHSEAEDDRAMSPTKGRHSLEVPGRRPFKLRHRTNRSTSFLPTFKVAPKKQGEAYASSDDERSARGGRKQDGRSSKPTFSVREISRDRSPARSVRIESLEEKSRRERAEETRIITDLDEVAAPPVAKPQVEISSASWEKFPYLDHHDHAQQPHPRKRSARKDIKRTRVLLLSSGILARGIPSRNASNTTAASPQPPPSIAVLTKQAMVSATQHSQEITLTSRHFAQQSYKFSSSTAASLQAQILAIHDDITSFLTPMVRRIADDADELNREVTTTHTLAVKKVGDEVGVMGRMRRRRLRWIRRSGYILLEWVVVVVMWAVWLVVVGVRCVRMGVMGVIRGVRWVLWI
ncbi:hypothetical protein RUND412_000818 [Rhizina undulata]